MLFGEVADLSPEERTVYFEANRVPRALVTEIESLLGYDRPAETLAGLVAACASGFDTPPIEYCGPYRLVRLIGHGGMGSVYEGRRSDGEVDLQVAVKLVRAAGFPIFQERFVRERQILASLKHPGVARLLDAGHTPAGQPWLAMEFVDGVPVDVFCAGLRLREKLNLFLRVCEAVSWLHQNLVIHRDLKPSNILVERNGNPKLLDFGIAKMIDENADSGQTRERILTPDYGSPEQILGTARTTATDVYSLGVILYVLLTGSSPYPQPAEGRSLEELVLNVQPAPPRRFNRALPHDLDFVTAKALRKDPTERYVSVDALAADVRAVLESRPVKARSGTAVYLTRKFLRRHWLPSAAVSAAILSLTIGIVEVSRERAVAQHRFAQLRQLSNQLLALDDDVRGLPGSTKTREHILKISTVYLDGLEREAGDDADLMLEVAKARMVTAEILGVRTSSSLGRIAEAEHTLDDAEALVRRALAAGPRSPRDAMLLGAQIEADHVIAADAVTDWDREESHAERATGYLDAFAKAGAASREQMQAAARVAMNVGHAEMNMHHYARAVPDIRASLGMMKAAGSSQADVAQGLSLLGNAQRQSGDLTGALASVNEARRIAEHADFRTPSARVLALYAIYWRQGVILGDRQEISWGRTTDAVEPFRKAFDIVYQASLRDPKDFSLRDRLGSVGVSLGDALRDSDPERALEIYGVTLERLREGTEQLTKREESKVLSHSSYALRHMHRFGEARQRVEDAMGVLHSLADYQARVGLIGDEWHDAMQAQAELDLELGRSAAARATLLELYRQVEARKPAPETDLNHAAAMSRIYVALSRAAAALSLNEEAAKFDKLRLALWTIWDRRLPGNWYIRERLQETVARP